MMASVTRDHKLFAVKVLWLQGRSVGAIAKAVGLTTGQVRGITTRAFQVPREKMTTVDRHHELKVLQMLVPDGVQLDADAFAARIIPITPAPRLPQKAGGREQLVRARVKVDDDEAVVEVFRAISDGIEEAAMKGWLFDSRSDGEDRGISLARQTAGDRLIAEFRRAQISSIGPVSFEPPVSGGEKNVIHDVAIDATDRLIKLQAQVHQPCWPLLVCICRDGGAVVSYARQARKKQGTIRQLLRRALDEVAVFYGSMDEKEYRRRWGLRRIDAKLDTMLRDRGEAQG